MALKTSPAQLQELCQESRQPRFLAMEWSFSIIAVVVVSLRLYCRRKFGKGLGWDDYIFVAGGMIGLPDPFLNTKWAQSGLGKHIECLGPIRAYATIQWSVASQALHIACLGLVKISVCLCVLRVIDRVERRIAAFLWVNIALVGAIHVAQLAMLLAECRPLSALWDPRVHGRCYSPNTTYTTTYIAFSLDAFTDLVCSGIPIFVFYRMQMNRRTKVALSVLMGLGIIPAMCAVAKAITLKGIWSRDYTWNEVTVVKWACAEQALSLILVSLPFFRPLFRNFFTLSRLGCSPPKAPTRSSPFQNYLLSKSTRNGNAYRKGSDAPYARMQDGCAVERLPSIPLAVHPIQPPVDLNVRAQYADLERGQ